MMKPKQQENRDDIAVYIENQEYIANKYVLKCYLVTMLVLTVAFFLNLLGIFIVEESLMWKSYFSSLGIYCIVWLVTKKVSLSDRRLKYFILFCIVVMFTVMSMYLTYHTVLVTCLPFLYATLYSSKKMIRYVLVLSMISAIVIVYGGYFFGLCDANMVLLTTGSINDHVENGKFLLTEINQNPYVSLMLFYVSPRWLIYIAIVAICKSIIKIVSGSLERARLTDALEKAKLEAERANQAKSQFLAKVSHEIRTPINAILGINEMIARESSEKEIQQYSVDVKSSSLMLLDIINDILDSAKIESGKMEIVEDNYEMASLFNDVYNMMSIKAKEKGLKLIFDIDSNIPSSCYGDDKRIRQILLNLLSNGVKYTNQGEVTLRVTFVREEENVRLQYSVKDTGIGIKKEDLKKLYVAYQRLDVAKNRHVEGTGLGMNIVQQLLGLMGTELQIQSEYEKGSEFSFELVQKIVDETPMGNFKDSLKKAANNTVQFTRYTAPDATILVVDDFAMNLRVFSGLLKPTQIKVVEAKSGKECLALMREQEFDMVFLDHMMPEMDGIETLYEIKKSGICENAPVIMLTANAIVGDKEAYLREGFDDFLSKPLIPKELEEMILKYLPEELIQWKDETRQEMET